jgi:hypothetical protein
MPGNFMLPRSKKTAFFLFTVFLLAVSCRKRDIPVPAYVHIPSMELAAKPGEGTSESALEFVTVFMNDNPLGTFPVPCTFPVLASGPVRLDFRPRIKQMARDGMQYYTLLEAYSEVVDLAEKQVDTVRPAFEYVSNREFVWLEDFNNNTASLTLKLGTMDTFYVENKPEISLDGTPYLRIPMESGESYFELESADIFNLPMDGRDVYLEIHYKTNITFTVGLYASNSQQVVAIPSASPYSTGLEWRKGYIYLRDDVVGNNPDTRFRIFFRAFNTEAGVPEIYIDNIKLLYRKS